MRRIQNPQMETGATGFSTGVLFDLWVLIGTTFSGVGAAISPLLMPAVKMIEMTND
jgi:hypothetical protein